MLRRPPVVGDEYRVSLGRHQTRERRSALIVYVSSVVGRFTIPFGGVYTASKWALEALAETAFYELAPFGIDIAIVQPGAFETNISNSGTNPDDPQRLAGYTEIAPLAQRPAGTRPLRSTVPEDAIAMPINEATAPIQREAIRAFGLEALLPTAAPAA